MMYYLPNTALNHDLTLCQNKLKIDFKQGSKKCLITSSRIFSLSILATAGVH